MTAPHTLLFWVDNIVRSLVVLCGIILMAWLYVTVVRWTAHQLKKDHHEP